MANTTLFKLTLCTLVLREVFGACTDEQAINIPSQPEIRVSQGETKAVHITHASPKYTGIGSMTDCPIYY